MNQFPLHADEDQDSLFGSPPPSPARGRSPPQATPVARRETGHIIAVPSTGIGRKNVGTIALPGSHMSCAELPADLPASSLSHSCSTSSHDPSCIAPPNITGTPILVHTPVMTSQASTRSVTSRAPSTVSTILSVSTRKRRTPKSKSLTPISLAPPITIPEPDQPTPPNFLRSQSSLLGLAGLVGCVKPAQLYAHDPQPPPLQQPRRCSPMRGSAPTHPIVLDDDRDAPHIGKHSCCRIQAPQRLDQLDPEILRSNVINSLTKEKNLFPVLESLIKLLGGEPYSSPANPPPQPFARPYGHGIFSVRSSPSTPPLSTPGGSTTVTTISASKRRKLRHVPAGAVDWDVPFPFAAGEGPEAYRYTWTRDRAKQLVTQLLELVQSATKRAAIKTAKNGGKAFKERGTASRRSVSVETQPGQISSTQPGLRSPYAYAEPAVTGVTIDHLGHYPRSSETPSAIGSPASSSKDRVSMDSAVEETVPYDYLAFEEWLSQLQHVLPAELDPARPEPTRQSVPLDSSVSSPARDICVPMQLGMRDEAIDPVLLAISQLSESAPRSQSLISTTTLTPGDMPQTIDLSPSPPALAHSPRTSLSSLTEPFTPLSEAFAVNVLTSTMAHQDLVRDSPTHRSVEKVYLSRPIHQVRAQVMTGTPCINAAEKGKAQVDDNVTSPMASSVLSPSAPSALSTFRGPLDKQAILDRAQEYRRQLAAEIERTKIELWETAIENAVLVHLTKDGLP